MIHKNIDSEGLDHSQTAETTSSEIKNHNSVINMPPLPLPPNIKFGPFKVSSQVFHLSPSKLSYGLVNLKPLLPGHILVCPVRSVPRLSQLTIAETTDLFLTVRRVSHTLERLYSAQALNVAVQDGIEAGQSVPHVHVHIIPRRQKDMDSRGGSDAIYELMDGEEGDIGAAMMEIIRRRKEKRETGKEFGGPDVDDQRTARSEEEMKKEAEWLKEEIERDEDGYDEEESSK